MVGTQEYFNMIVKALDMDSQEKWSKAGAYTLGELSLKLTPLPHDKLVRFSNGSHPNNFHSYRGYYKQVAIEETMLELDCSAFLQQVDDAIGQTYEGWKGGDYTMHRGTFVFVSEEGTASGIMITDVVEHEDFIELVTRELDDV